MGYQGDDGEIGIQGLVGENGAVWDDGIRLSGYNTHLFVWDQSQSKFVPKNPDEDILKVNNGAVIRIYLTQEAYNGLLADNGDIKVDTLSSNQMVEHSAPAYYAGNDAIINHITQFDYDTVIDFTYYEGAWYYSGGLIGYSEFDTIVRRITVKGGRVGGYDEGDNVEPGTSIQDLFEKLLVRDVDVAVGETPSTKMVLRNGGSMYIEVGSPYTNELAVTYFDGYFESADKTGYTDAEFNTNNSTSNGKLLAQCSNEGTRFFMDGTQMPDQNISIQSAQEKVYEFTSETDYSRSAAVPKTSENNDSEVHIPAGVAESNDIKLEGRYKMFYGTHTLLAPYNYNDPNHYRYTTKESLSELNGYWMELGARTVIESIESTSAKPSFVIAVPSGWSVTSTKNEAGVDVQVATTWYPQNTIEYVNGSVTTTYQVYVSPSTEPSEYTEITLTRQQ